jgi:chitinase
MTRGRTALWVAALLAIAGASSESIGQTESAFTASGATGGSVLSAAPDWAPPTGAAVVGRTSAYDTGAIKQGGSYYVYANLSDSGNPASGTATATANIGTISVGHAPVPLVAGAYNAGGQSYNYRTAAETATALLAQGTYTFLITATDSAGNSGTQSFNTTVDNTPPVAVDLQSTNVSGGTPGHLGQGDTLSLTFSGVMDPYSILAGWNGGSTTAVQVALVDGGGTASDYMEVYDTAATPAYIPLGVVYLGSPGYLNTGVGTYITFGGQGASSHSTMVRSGATITVTLGTPSGLSSTNATPAAMTLAPSGPATDIAGNPLSPAWATQSGTPHLNF